VLIDLLAKLLFYDFEGLLLCIAFVHEGALLLDEDRGGVSDLNDATEARVQPSALREVLDLGVLAIELGQQLHVVVLALLEGRSLAGVA
jgi:hypothetical protein